MTTSMPNSPDDLCGVCDITRENHGDMQHKFSIDGILESLPTPSVPKGLPPQTKGSAPTESMQIALMLRTIERLTAKGIFNGEDLVYIFGGDHANNRWQNPPTTSSDSQG